MVLIFFERNVAGLGIFSGPLSLSRFLKDVKVSTLTLGENFIRFVFKLEPIIYSLINIFLNFEFIDIEKMQKSRIMLVFCWVIACLEM